MRYSFAVSCYWRHGDHKGSIVANDHMLLSGELFFWTPFPTLGLGELSKELVGTVVGTVAEVGGLRAGLSSGVCPPRWARLLGCTRHGLKVRRSRRWWVDEHTTSTRSTHVRQPLVPDLVSNASMSFSPSRQLSACIFPRHHVTLTGVEAL